jgi:hypothetical protein
MSLHKSTFRWEVGEKEKTLDAAETGIFDIDRGMNQKKERNEVENHPSTDEAGDWDMLSEIFFHNGDPLMKVFTDDDEAYNNDPNRQTEEKIESDTGSDPDSTDSSGDESSDEKKEIPMSLYDRMDDSSWASSSEEESSESDVDASETYESDSEKDNEGDIEESDSD